MAKAPVQTNLILLLYRIGFPLLVLYFLYRAARDKRYLLTLGERFGCLPASFQRTAPGSVWLHAVSVGEVISAVRLVEELRAGNPAIPLYLSTTTLSGRAIAEQRLGAKLDGIFYSPVDSVFVVRRVLRRIRPAVVVILETEIWPVMFREAKRAGCGLIVWNGRISDRAFPSYRKLKWFFGPVLALADAIHVQSETDRQRYISLGAPLDRVKVSGNLKYDAAPFRIEPPACVNLAEAVWIAASTMPGLDANDVDEDDIVLAAFQELAPLHPGLLLILAPRRPERFDVVAAKLEALGIGHLRRSGGVVPERMPLPGVLLLDTIGELAGLFAFATVVFVGGTLARRGGHNVLEPAAFGKPIIAGPHMENFPAIAAEFHAGQAWVEIAGPAGLQGAVHELLSDPQRRDCLGQRAARLAAKNTGAARRAAAEILAAQDMAIPCWNRPGSVSYGFLWLLSQVWMAVSRRNVGSRKLTAPVISVGGIAMGGTGKTPFVQMLARKLRERGLQPAILTRGYRRKCPVDMLIPAGAARPVVETGDEAQILVRDGSAHVAIGADRYAMGKRLAATMPVDVFLLDDGFQHRKLYRDLDIVLIDSLDPFPGDAVFPLGRMREPVEGLARAGAFVITRAQPGRAYLGIREKLRKVNPDAPVFLAGVRTRGWEPGPLTATKVAAFCGLGNLETFWQTLREMGLEVVKQWTYTDHHRYTLSELERMAGPVALVTTEKDAMNLPEASPIQIHWLKIETVVEKEEALLERVASVAGSERKLSL